ncbi:MULTISPECIES: PucR family transcriptional regulator [unclassified Pseudoclavibacter]|uniref:PucR family transcriptional regulator n=1 Tax=unclassified Pseudoclavibacter TaxID=2615177 RepID=UPI001357F2F9|nr:MULTISPECIES: helix-turn-helix domain-containing protein [unclassified Pseudoclavibacter]MBF4458437.1 helix-turn-helix domain-containing protein [Pseudoclavibacter sp. VKM Ac-2867]
MTSPSPSGISRHPRTEDRERWLAIIDLIEVPQLVEAFMDLIFTIPGYASSLVPRSEIRRTATQAFDAMIDGLREGGLPDVVEVANRVGVSRARADVPLSSLMSAIHADFQVLWEAVTRTASPSDAGLIVRHTAVVIRTVDEYAHRAQRAYVAERERMQGEASAVLQGHIASLFEGAPANDRLQAVAAHLGVQVSAPLLVCAAVGSDTEALRLLLADFDRVGTRFFTHTVADGIIAFAPRSPWGDRTAASAAQLQRLREQRVGLVEARRGLPELGQTAQVALSLARLLGPDEVDALTWERGWARFAKRAVVDAGVPLLADVDAALARCGPSEQTRLREAVVSYLRTGNISGSAAELFCHRNTLGNRLRRFAEVTGLDPMLPGDAARLVVAWS